jgi:integrase
MSTIGHARPSNRAKTRWEIKYAVNRKTQYATIDARSEREALQEIAKRVAAGVALTGSAKLTLGDYMPRWLESLDLKPTTRQNYGSVVRTYLAPDLGGYRLRELTPSGIRTAFIKWHGEGAARSSLRQVKVVLQSCLRSALLDDLISINPMDRLRARKGEKNPLPIGMPPKAKPVSADKIAELLGEESTYHILIVLMVAAGVRRGEALALRWRNVDLNSGKISIVEQRIPLTGGARFAEPKAASSVRTITLPPEAIDQLLAHRKTMRERMFANGHKLGDDTTVACRDDGAPLDPNAFGSWARRRGFKLHNLRHAHLSALANSGKVPIAAVSKRAGHSTIATTIATYVHAEEADDEAAAAVAGGFF